MLKLIKYLTFAFLLSLIMVVEASAQGWVGRSAIVWKTTSDTSNVDKSVGNGYYFTSNGKYYIGAGSYLKLVTDQSSAFAGGDVSNTTLFHNGLKTDWIRTYTTGKDTIGFHANPVFYPMGNALSLDGANDYAYHSATNTLDIGTEDFMFSGWFYVSDTPTSYWRIYELTLDASAEYRTFLKDGYDVMDNVVDDGTTVFHYHITGILGNWHNIVNLSDVGNKYFIFLDGKYHGEIDISGGSIPSSGSGGEIHVGSNRTYSDKLKGLLNNDRIFRFGQSGLYVIGTGGNDLEIRVGSSTGDIIYSEKSPYSPSHPGGLIPAMYRNPGASLGELGYGGLENADRSELTQNSGAESGNTNGWYCGGSNSIDIESSVVHSGSYSIKATYQDALGFAFNTLSSNTVSNKLYVVSAWVYVPSGWNGGDVYCNLNNGSVSPDIEVWKYKWSSGSSANDTWVYIETIIKGNFNALAARVRTTSAPDVGKYIYIDDISVKRIGEVAQWPMNESGTPLTLADETDNNLDLTTVGSPAMVNADYQNLALKRMWADTIMADSAIVRRVYTNRLGLPFLPSSEIPSSGDTIPGLYSYGGEVYAHDASGNNTVISPHAVNGDWVFNSWNANTGIRTWVDMLKALKALEEVSGEKFIYQDTVFEEVSPEKAIAGLDTVTVYEDSLINKWNAFTWNGLKKELKKNVWFDEEKNLYYMRVKRVKPFVKLKAGIMKKGKRFYKLNASKLAQPPTGVKP